MNEDITRLKLPKPSAIWFEKLSHKDQSLPDWKCLRNYEVASISPSGRLLFFHFYGQLMVVDLWCGVPTKLRTVNMPFDVSLSYQFYAQSDKEGWIVKRTTVANGVELAVAKFKMDFATGRLTQLTQWSHLITLSSLYEISPLPSSCSVLVHGQQLDRRLMIARREKFLAVLDLEKLQFISQIGTFTNQLYDPREHLTMCTEWEGQFYGFLRIGVAKKVDQFDFTFIARVDPTTNKRETELLANHHECFSRQLGGQKISFVDSVWRQNLLYLHLTVQPPLNKSSSIPYFLHYFARLDLKTLKWTRLEIGNETLRTCVPLKMAINGEENVLILVETSNARVLHADTRDTLENNAFFANGGHIHARIWRIPISSPEPLHLLSLFTLNRLCPGWKLNPTENLPLNSLIRPLFRVDPRQCRPTNNFGGNLRGLKCVECTRNEDNPSETHHLIPDYLRKNPRSLMNKETIIRFLWAILPITVVSILFYLVFRLFVK